jgi:hypothetical protein
VPRAGETGRALTAAQLCDPMQCVWQLSARCPYRLASTAAFRPPPATKPSRFALSATNALHKSLNAGALEQSFYIVNSLRYAALSKPQQQDKAWDAIRPSLATIPPGVSPRLPAHALMHGLVRFGMPQQASALATSMMNSGLRVRCKTLEKVVDGLAKTPANNKAASRDVHFKAYMAKLLATPDILSLNPSMTSHHNTAFALELLKAAKESGSQRSTFIFNTLITLCLINGEIILAALLFGILVKDWEHRSVVLTQMTAAPPEPPEPVQPSKDVHEARRHNLMSKLSKPEYWTLREIMVPIQKRLDKATYRDTNTPEFQEALQSLAYLASLLDERKLPFPQISSVLRGLAKCPTVQNWIWVQKKRGMSCVPTNSYFRNVFYRLIYSLPGKDPKQRSIDILSSSIPSIKYQLVHPVYGMQPPLDLASYNTLIHYALRDRFSPALAQQVYKHMAAKREPPLRHSQATYGVYLRAATLYGRKDVTSGALQDLLNQVDPPNLPPIIPDKPRFDTLPRRLIHAGRSEISLPPAPSLDIIMKDRYLLSIYLSSLLSSKRHKAVHKLMLRLLPYFSRGSHHNNGPAYRPLRSEKWHQSVAAAATLGPHVLCAFVVALTRAGYLSKLMALFKLIFLASSKSREEEGSGKGWYVTIPLYTAVLQARYAAHQRRSRKIRPLSLKRLLQTTNGIYIKVMRNTRSGLSEMGTPDARFYAAVLKILKKLVPAPKSSVQKARQQFEAARQLYADTGKTYGGEPDPLLMRVVEDLQEDGFTVPIGFQYLFLGRRICLLGNHGDSPELERRPSVFNKRRKLGGPYSVPVYNTKSIPLRLHPPPFKKVSPSPNR